MVLGWNGLPRVWRGSGADETRGCKYPLDAHAVIVECVGASAAAIAILVVYISVYDSSLLANGTRRSSSTFRLHCRNLAGSANRAPLRQISTPQRHTRELRRVPSGFMCRDELCEFSPWYYRESRCPC